MTAAPVELSVTRGSETLPFTLVRNPRTTIKISVTPGGEIRVYAPPHATDEQVVARVQRRLGWIDRQLRSFEKWRPRTPPRQYESGETHLYLGRQYRLQVTSVDATSVHIDGGRLVLAVPEESSFTYRRAVLRHWYKLQCHSVFPDRLDTMFPPFQRQGIERPRLIIREMKVRWGSYTANGSLVLNTDLIRANPAAIDYVITHELAHALHPDHGESWRELMAKIMPDWQQRKVHLERSLI